MQINFSFSPLYLTDYSLNILHNQCYGIPPGQLAPLHIASVDTNLFIQTMFSLVASYRYQDVMDDAGVNLLNRAINFINGPQSLVLLRDYCSEEWILLLTRPTTSQVLVDTSVNTSRPTSQCSGNSLRHSSLSSVNA